ncbi:MAG: hypothetical protein LBE76_05050 [Nitrososphaerota archaeon]|jgi:hypothetical protein|nr:hypothetical protein [Nitrososphaerota archaeon]
MCDDIVHTNAIGVRTAGATKIEFYNSLMPHPNASTKNLGSVAQYWNNTYGGYIYGKNMMSPGCARSLSGQEWVQKIQCRDVAEEVLTHEITKTLRHITYSDEADDEIICVCGKSVKEPCPEHLDEWNDQYCKNESKRIEAASFLVLEHAVDLVKLSNALAEANEKIRMLEQKIEKITALNEQ